MIHQLKQASIYFEDVISGKKPFEVRKNDRNFKVGDYLALNELTPHECNEKGEHLETGRSALFRVTYILDNPEYCKEGFVVLGIKPCNVSMSSNKKAMILDEKEPGVNVFESLANLGAALNEAKTPKN